MKKLFLLLTMVAMFAVACTEGNEDPQDPTSQPTKGPISVSQGRVNFDFNGGESELTVNAKYSWVATCSANWITLQTPDGIAGTEPLKFKVMRNTTLSERTATITLKNENYDLIQEVYVIQSQFKPVMEIAEKSISLEYTSCEKFIKVTSNVPYNVVCEADWLTCTTVDGGINLSAKGNGAFEPRSAQITITAQENPKALSIQVSVVQEAADSRYVIYYTSYNGYIVRPDESAVFGANLIGNYYKDNQGVLIFDGPITSIGYAAFHDCTSLTSITIPNSVTTIGSSAFLRCLSLTDITIPDSVTAIESYAFSYCTSLKNVTIGNSVTAIGYEAFSYCSSLTNVTIGNSVIEIGRDAFRGCTSLTDVTIGNSVTTIGGNAFSDCSSLTSITIPNSVTTIGYYAFSHCTSLKNVTIGNSVTTIGSAAFWSCSSLKEITIPESVTSIENNAFSDCSSLTNVTIGNSVTTIGSCAFSDCSSLTNITLPNSVTSIGFSAFENCSSLETVYCKPTTPPSLDKDYPTFRGCTLISIYVPRNSYNQYIKEWSRYDDVIKPYDF